MMLWTAPPPAGDDVLLNMQRTFPVWNETTMGKTISGYLNLCVPKTYPS
jgi:hypothetical protein